MARPKLGEGETLRFQLVIADHEMEAIEIWKHENRVPSTAEAIRRLCKMAIERDYPRGNERR